MRRPKYIVPVVLILFTAGFVCGQSASVSFDETYGLDPLLHNGRYYTYHVPSDTKGSPFFNGPQFVQGSVHLRGLTYDDLSLKYDVYNQLLVLEYVIHSGGVKHIVISEAWLESFKLGEAYFELISVSDSINQIYQVIGNGPSRVFYSWSKKRMLNSAHGAKNFVFSPSIRKAFLFSDYKFMNYKNNKSFVALFDPVKQALIKKHMGQKKIKVRKASDQAMDELVSFCNILPSE